MDINSIIDNIKYSIASGNKGKIVLTENSFLLDLLSDKQLSQKRFKPFMNWKDFQGHSFPVTRYLFRFLLYVVEYIIWLCYGFLRILRLLFFGKKRDKDPSTSPRVNFVIFVSMIIFYIVLIIMILVFFLKSVLLFNPQGSTNNQGAIVLPQNCGKEHYIYLFNSATCWANTGIKVIEGDEIIISASGSFFGKISLMESCAENNCRPKYPRSIISYYNSKYDVKGQESEEESRTRTLLMYNKKDAKFGSLLMQIKEDNEDFLYTSDSKDDENKQMMQIEFTDQKDAPHISIKKSGVLYFSVNDIYLTNAVIDSIKNDTDLQKNLEIKNIVIQKDDKDTTICMKDIKEKDYSLIDRSMWFEDNVGEILLNITVVRDILPANSSMPAFMVKTYRWIEEKTLSSTKEKMKSPEFLILWFFLGIMLWLAIDRMIGAITKNNINS